MIFEGIRDKIKHMYWKAQDMGAKNIFKHAYGRAKRTKCDVECWNYGMFGGKGGCEALDSWGSIHEPLEPEERCLHPEKKEYADQSFVVSNVCLDSILSGGVDGIAVTDENDANFVELLTGIDVKDKMLSEKVG